MLSLARLPAAWGQDIVYLSSASNPRSSTRLAGKVLEYTGSELVLELPGGRQRKFPAARVRDIESEWTEPHSQGNALFAKGQHCEAIGKYQAAVRAEPRRWVQRMILARLIECYAELNQLAQAGELFLTLFNDDPATPYFHVIPLSWLPAEPNPQLELKAREWMARHDAPAVLLAASHLLPGPLRQAALERLEPVAKDPDPRIASLAQAQLWRGAAATASQEQLAAWKKNLEEFPEDLRAGPYLALGRIAAQRGDPVQAALLLLHVPILYPQQRSLAAEGLLAAAQSLEKTGPADLAPTLYRELAAHYSSSRPGSLARQKLQELGVELVPPALPVAAAGSLEARFLDGLRGRRLFELAETACRDRLDATGLSNERRSRLAIELSRSFTEHALHSAPDKREPLWQQAIDALDQSGAQADHPWRVLEQVQRGLMHLARGELARQEAELVRATEQQIEQARTHLRAAVKQLEEAAAAVAAQQRQANQRGPGQPDGLSESDLASLADHVSYQLARAFRNQGQCYPAGSPDRANSLRQSVNLLSTLARTDVFDALTWNARLDEIVCYRLLEDFRAAYERIELLTQREPPPQVHLAARAEEIRLALDQGRLEDALAAADEQNSADDETSGNLDYARLEAHVAAWRAADQADNTRQARQWQSEAANLVRAIDARHGAYWRRRAETLLAGTLTGSADPTGVQAADMALLVRAAESFYRAGQIDEALATYDRAVQQANRDGKRQEAFEADYAAAAIEQEHGHYPQAASRFRRSALAAPDHPQAADAHLLAIYNMAQAAKSESQPEETDSRSVDDEYLRLLDEHLGQWPQGPSASQARLWLGRLQSRRQEWQRAVEAFRQVAREHAGFAEAVQGIGDCYVAWLEQLQAGGQPTGQLAEQAAGYLEGLINRLEGGSGQWGAAEQAAAIGAARVRLRFGNNQFAEAEQLLLRALAAADDQQPAWKSAAQGLLLVALAGQGRREEAGKLVEGLARGSPRRLLELLKSLARIRETAADAVRPELAELELVIARRLRTDQEGLREDEQRAFERAFVVVLSQAGRRGEALHAAKELTRRWPRDGDIHEDYARLLLEGPDQESLEAALAQWHQIQQKSRPGSDRWLRAMYSMALAHERLGNLDRAIGMVKLARAQYPALGGPEMHKQFEDLLARCQR